MIRLIAIDLDGSLLTDEKRLPADFGDLADRLLSEGVYIVIASGRPFTNVSSLFKRLKDQLYFACDNGSYVVHADEEILTSTLDTGSIKKFVEISRPIKSVYPVLCGKNIAFIEDDDPAFKTQALKYYEKFVLVDDLTTVEDMILKISLCDLAGTEFNSYPFYQQFTSTYGVTISGKIWLDITHAQASKGNAIKELQKKLQITPEETLVFGDYLNDLDMIENAGFSYAMKNAHPGILQAAKYVTEFDNNHAGVTHTIKKLFEI